MCRVPLGIKIFLLNVVTGFLAIFVILFSKVLVFGLGGPIFTLAPARSLPPPPVQTTSTPY